MGYLKDIITDNLRLQKSIEVDFGNTVAWITVSSMTFVDSILKIFKFIKYQDSKEQDFPLD